MPYEDYCRLNDADSYLMVLVGAEDVKVISNLIVFELILSK